jgi:hypothetical protein
MKYICDRHKRSLSLEGDGHNHEGFGKIKFWDKGFWF